MNLSLSDLSSAFSNSYNDNLPSFNGQERPTAVMLGLKSTALVVPLAALLFYVYNGRQKSGPSVHIANGILQGISSKSRDGNPYFEFLGIPYAMPPTGDLRFEPPIPTRSWDGVRPASAYGPKCVQIEFFTGKLVGQEDCLQLNVFTPKLPEAENGKHNRQLLPVMVYIHGGYFMAGSAVEIRPQYFMQKGLDIVFVSLNYRLASLGFLNTEDGIVRGNMGLKDQNLALRWVQANIHHFGGDKNRVTIFGCSAGASAVSYHILSPMSKGLFAKAITQSGSAIKQWSFVRHARRQAFQLGERVNCPTNDTQAMVTCLKNTDANIIMMTHRDYTNVILDPLALYAPSIEYIKDENAFLAKEPYDILKNGEQNDIPLMSGVNSDDGLLVTARILKNQALIDEIDGKWEMMAPKMLAYLENTRAVDITTQVKKFYLDDQPVGFLWSFQNFTDMMSDRLYFTANRETAILHSQKSPVYMYYFTYPAQFSLSSLLTFTGKLPTILELMFNLASKWINETILGKNTTRLGICHGDETLLLFDMGFMFSIKPGDKDYDMSQAMVKLWTDFAAAPYESTLQFRNVIWKPTKKSIGDLYYLNIGSNPEIIEEPFKKRALFWRSLGFL